MGKRINLYATLWGIFGIIVSTNKIYKPSVSQVAFFISR